MAGRIMTGIVVSERAEKTISVRIDRSKRHPLYSKSYLVSKKFAVHDEASEAHVGDVVQVQETRPVSKTKSWRLLRVVRRSEGTETDLEEAELKEVLNRKAEEAEEATKEAEDDTAKEKPAKKPAAKKSVKAEEKS